VLKAGIDNVGTQPPTLTSLSTGSDETFQQISTWLRSCDSHDACGESSVTSHGLKSLPTRLLKLTNSELHPQVKLIDTAQIGTKTLEYATLSHCWGDTLAVKLLKSSLESFKLNIQWSDLPKTFQETILVVLHLNIDWLWIDALCIIQDDNDDWRLEAANMMNVYAGSKICIAADASKNGTEGLFRERDPEHRQLFYAPHSKSSAESSWSMIFHRGDWRHVDNAPLTQRAWTIQEKYLAPKVLRFTERDVVWQCSECIKVESIPISFDNQPMMHSMIKKSAWKHSLSAHEREQTAYQLWHELATSYTAGSLTVTSDRPIAISGLARVFSGMLNLPENDYLCGLWRPRLVHGLMWHANGNWSTPPDIIRIQDLPSWSWLSLCREMWQYPGTAVHNRHLLSSDFSTVDVLDAFTVPIGDPFGPVSAAEVTLRAPLCQVIFKENHDLLRDGEYSHGVCHMLLGKVILRQYEHFTFHPDEDGRKAMLSMMNLPMYLMLGRARKLKPEQVTLDSKTADSEIPLW
jgi:hypothetical protein